MEIKYCGQFIFRADRVPIKLNESKLNCISIMSEVHSSELKMFMSTAVTMYHAPTRETNKIFFFFLKSNDMKQIKTGEHTQPSARTLTLTGTYTRICVCANAHRRIQKYKAAATTISRCYCML